jgi:tetratricopeptide (TPR) repeat protein
MICSGDKDIENRNWKTDFRGTIAIHASTKVTQVNGLLKRDKVKQVKRGDFEYGAIIGLADIESISIYGREHETNPHAFGPYCWKMTNGRFLKNPIPMMGKLGLVYLSDELTASVLSQETFQIQSDSPIRSLLQNNMEAKPSVLELYEYCVEDLYAKATIEELWRVVNRMIELDAGPYAHICRLDFACQSDEVSLPVGYCEAFENAVIATYGVGSDDKEFRRIYEDCLESEANPDEYKVTNQLRYDPSCFYQHLTVYLHTISLEFLKLGQYDKAMEYSNRRLSVEPDAPETHVDLGEIYLKGFSDAASAVSSLRIALKLCDFGRAPDAELKIASYLDKDPEFDRQLLARLLLLLSQAFREVGEIDEAMSISTRLVKFDKENPLAFVEAHKVAIQKNDAKLAKKYMKKAFELDPEIGQLDGE